MLCHHLNISQTGTIIDFQKGKTSLRVPPGFHPSLHQHFSPLTMEKVFDFCSLHKLDLFPSEPSLEEALLIDIKGVFRYFRKAVSNYFLLRSNGFGGL
jgi:hypothetical protein